MVAHEPDEHVDVGRGEAHPRPDPLHQLDADFGVVAGIALAEIVQPRADEQQVGPLHAIGEARRLHRGLEQVPVDGEPVIRIVLRAAAHRLPLREQAHHEAVLVEGLERGDRTRARTEQRDERVEDGRGPRIAGRRGFVAESFERRPRDRRAGSRRGGRDAHGQARVVHRRVRERDDLAVAEHDAFAQRAVARRDTAARAGERALDAPPRVVARPADRARRARHPVQHRVGVGEPEHLGDGGLLLEHEEVGALARGAVQRDAHLDELAPCGADFVVERGQRRDCERDRAQRVHVAQAAPPLLQLRLEQERDVAVVVMTLHGRVGERAHPALVLALPVGERAARQGVAERGIAGDRARVEQAERGPEVVVGDGERFVDGLDAVVEGDARFPDRIPDALRDLVDVATLAVHEQHVEVAPGCELGPPVPAHCDERDVGFVAEQTGEPAVGVLGEGVTELQAVQGFVGEDRAALVVHAHYIDG